MVTFDISLLNFLISFLKKCSIDTEKRTPIGGVSCILHTESNQTRMGINKVTFQRKEQDIKTSESFFKSHLFTSRSMQCLLKS